VTRWRVTISFSWCRGLSAGRVALFPPDSFGGLQLPIHVDQTEDVEDFSGLVLLDVPKNEPARLQCLDGGVLFGLGGAGGARDGEIGVGARQVHR